MEDVGSRVPGSKDEAFGDVRLEEMELGAGDDGGCAEMIRLSDEREEWSDFLSPSLRSFSLEGGDVTNWVVG